ncbi:hypothetical protein JC221_238 [Yersinia phage JC221]|nr:hypothetical protein JC221_238 [Yersinia phage JC221]
MATHEELKGAMEMHLKNTIRFRAERRYHEYLDIKEAISRLMSGCIEADLDVYMVHWAGGLRYVYTFETRSLIFSGNSSHGYKVRIKPK